MKDGTQYATKLKRLCTRLKREYDKPEPPPPTDPVEEIVFACLTWQNSESHARTALRKLHAGFVDYNELRVCRPEEVADILGRNVSKAREAANSMTTVLQSVFDKCDCLDLSELQESGKREARSFLEGLEGATPYIVSHVMLNSLSAHAVPVNEMMLNMLRAEEVVDPDASLDEVQSFLERHLSAKDVRISYARLRQHAEQYKPGRKRTRAAKATAKKTTRKRTTKKTTGKKTS